MYKSEIKENIKYIYANRKRISLLIADIKARVNELDKHGYNLEKEKIVLDNLIKEVTEFNNLLNEKEKAILKE